MAFRQPSAGELKQRYDITRQQQMASMGGTGTVSWSVSSGALPTGWTLTAAGMLSGVATTDGTYTFTIKAQDLGNPPQTAQVPYAVSIAEPLVITSSATFPNACVNKPYTFQVTTSGGTPPIRFSFLSYAWVAINLDQNTGIFSGTANVTGTFTGSLGAIDSSQPLSTAGQTVTLTVVNCP